MGQSSSPVHVQALSRAPWHGLRRALFPLKTPFLFHVLVDFVSLEPKKFHS